ncbi:glycosyl transferase [Elizabethkingia argentiflava]|uniref:Peptide O-xylosyltransferase n=1 Tax=Elizabethkingia argenteiflava TaxID=2681556 RepID=A0A845PWU7_9FLAO|nr:beta-1,6-N-acetylglucosaminyltransferase [Elizabethkingia argenteiflava]NAW51336.1 glycosyl transferase [Elizabethkingia argenteiflava]
MKHAYLIIAHHEFTVLKLLLEALDDTRNDIYIHFDKKIKNIPLFECNHSNVYILENRVDVRWGHVSQIETEYALFEEAYRRGGASYSRYHLISGTHFPLKNQDQIHAFFQKYENQEILNFIYTNSYEVNMKLGRYHFFLKNYKGTSLLGPKTYQFLWNVLLKIQYIFNIKRREPNVSIKASNWVSLTPQAVSFIVQQKQKILKKFRRSFCADEYFIPYLLENNRDTYKMRNERRLLYNEFVNSNSRILTEEDYAFLMHSDYIFARKFSERHVRLIKKILKHIQHDKARLSYSDPSCV